MHVRIPKTKYGFIWGHMLSLSVPPPGPGTPPKIENCSPLKLLITGLHGKEPQLEWLCSFPVSKPDQTAKSDLKFEVSIRNRTSGWCGTRDTARDTDHGPRNTGRGTRDTGHGTQDTGHRTLDMAHWTGHRRYAWIYP